jgi:hypothetical protein
MELHCFRRDDVMEFMIKKKARKESAKAILASIKKEMAEPRITLSARVETESLASARGRAEHGPQDSVSARLRSRLRFHS